MFGYVRVAENDYGSDGAKPDQISMGEVGRCQLVDFLKPCSSGDLKACKDIRLLRRKLAAVDTGKCDPTRWRGISASPAPSLCEGVVPATSSVSRRYPRVQGEDQLLPTGRGDHSLSSFKSFSCPGNGLSVRWFTERDPH